MFNGSFMFSMTRNEFWILAERNISKREKRWRRNEVIVSSGHVEGNRTPRWIGKRQWIRLARSPGSVPSKPCLWASSREKSSSFVKENVGHNENGCLTYATIPIVAQNSALSNELHMANTGYR